MPELPEVEVIRRGLTPHLTGRAVVSVGSGELKLRKPVDHGRLRQWIVGHRVVAVERRAKYLLLRMENGAMLVFHLGMTGRLILARATAPGDKHDHLRFLLEDDLELRYNDIRRFGFMEVYTPAELRDDPFGRLGPEPFWESFSAAYLLAKARNRRRPVKSFLMDNSIVVGIGNIYASEILFAAAIPPLCPAGELTDRQWRRIVSVSRLVLDRAIERGGTTISDFVNESGRGGYFQNELQVYGRADQPCRACRTPVSRTLIAGRATFHCRRCQR